MSAVTAAEADRCDGNDVHLLCNIRAVAFATRGA